MSVQTSAAVTSPRTAPARWAGRSSRMTNYLGDGRPLDGIRDGVNRHVVPADQRAQMIAVEDVAGFAALAFADPDRYAGRTLELAGQGHGWHADIEVLRVLHPGLLTLADWLDRGGAELIRQRATSTVG